MIDIPTKSLELIVEALDFYIVNNPEGYNVDGAEKRNAAIQLKQDLTVVMNRSSDDHK